MANDPPERDVVVDGGGVPLPGILTIPEEAAGIVVFAHGSGSSRHSPRNVTVARALVGRGCATLLFDLLTEAEASDRANVFDVALLGRRVRGATAWLRRQEATGRRRVGYFGASTGAAAALVAAAEAGPGVAAVVSRGGRPDLAGTSLERVTAPTLLIVGGLDQVVLELNQLALEQLRRSEARLEIIEGAGHLFEEPGALEQVSDQAAAWFVPRFARSLES